MLENIYHTISGRTKSPRTLESNSKAPYWLHNLYLSWENNTFQEIIQWTQDIRSWTMIETSRFSEKGGTWTKWQGVFSIVGLCFRPIPTSWQLTLDHINSRDEVIITWEGPLISGSVLVLTILRMILDYKVLQISFCWCLPSGKLT